MSELEKARQMFHEGVAAQPLPVAFQVLLSTVVYAEHLHEIAIR